jgi:hypothetical protein
VANTPTYRETVKIWTGIDPEKPNQHHISIQSRMKEPNNWILLNRPNCIDVVCKGIIYDSDREIIQQYFRNAEICIWAWNSGLRLTNIVHLISKHNTMKCKFCTKTFVADDINKYREHVLTKHIAKNNYGRLKLEPLDIAPTLHTFKTLINVEPVDNQLTKIAVRQKEILNEYQMTKDSMIEYKMKRKTIRIKPKSSPMETTQINIEQQQDPLYHTRTGKTVIVIE